MSKLYELKTKGQSLWLDFIKRSMVARELKSLIDEGLLGLTSNPSIFEKSIAEDKEYESDLNDAATRGIDPHETYEALAIRDIQQAADAFRAVHRDSSGRDGFVSLEVSPELAHDAAGTLSEARRLWQRVARPNLMIKVPATVEGLPVIEQLISEGINVNVTLLFSVDVYEQVARRFMAGLRRRLAVGNDIGQVASVASFFVSRVDSEVDALLEARIAEAAGEERTRLESLLGKAAIANGKLAYQRYLALRTEPLWTQLAQNNAQPQRLLWASTGTKNKKYSDVLYVEELIGRDTVNTVPPATLDAFRDHGRIRDSLTEDVEDARLVMEGLARAGISMDSVATRLLTQGHGLFLDAFRRMLDAVERKARLSHAAAS